MAAKKKLTFEEQLDKVESLISEMEAGTMPLDTMLKAYDEGMQIIAAMEKELAAATQRLTVLRRGEDDQETEIPVEEDV